MNYVGTHEFDGEEIDALCNKCGLPYQMVVRDDPPCLGAAIAAPAPIDPKLVPHQPLYRAIRQS